MLRRQNIQDCRRRWGRGTSQEMLCRHGGSKGQGHGKVYRARMIGEVVMSLQGDQVRNDQGPKMAISLKKFLQPKLRNPFYVLQSMSITSTKDDVPEKFVIRHELAVGLMSLSPQY